MIAQLFSPQDLIKGSVYCLQHNSYDTNLGNLVLYQLIIPQIIFSFILVTFLLDIVSLYCKEKFCLGHS